MSLETNRRWWRYRRSAPDELGWLPGIGLILWIAAGVFHGLQALGFHPPCTRAAAFADVVGLRLWIGGVVLVTVAAIRRYRSVAD